MTDNTFKRKPTIVVSKCLGFASCRYNGDIINDPFVQLLKNGVSFIPVCPELEIGLGVPRKPVRLVRVSEKTRLYQPATSLDFTVEMNEFINRFISSHTEIDGFILKFNSPSCSPYKAKVYTDFENPSRVLSGAGMFGGAIVENFMHSAIEDEGRLTNLKIREYFLIRIYALAGFREAKKTGRINALLEYHAQNKYIFMAHNEKRMRELGTILSQYKKAGYPETVTAYEDGLKGLFNKVIEEGAWINALQHIFGGFSKKLTKSERELFRNSIEEYRDEHIPLSVLLRLLYSWALRFNEDYVLQQSILNPFPMEFISQADSAKRKL